MLYFTSKSLKTLFILNLDEGTYEASSTESGAFNNQPDQVARIVGSDILYFCEDGGSECGVHARDGAGRFFTILESDGEYDAETTGLAFSPNRMHMYVSFQGYGIFVITRDDGRPFGGATLDIKYHA